MSTPASNWLLTSDRRKSCGESVKGHTGMCAGSKVGELKSDKDCSAAGGAWITAADAAKLKHEH